MRDRPSSKKTKNAIRYWILGESALIAIFFLCILVGWIIWTIVDVRYHISVIRKSIAGMRDAAISLNSDALKEESSESVDAIHAISAKLSLFRFVSSMPFVGKNYDVSMQIVSDSERLLEGCERLIVGFDDAIRPARKETGELSFQSLKPEKKRLVIQKIFELLPQSVGIESQISLSIAHLGFIDETELYSAVRTVKQDMESHLRQAQEGIRALRPILELLPLMAGYPQEKTYLFLLQNNTEVRATGGFIGTYGIMHIQDGQIASFTTDNTYNLDDSSVASLAVDPPPPFLRYFPSADRKWFLRDANWFPSFDESARQAEWFYSHEGGKEHLDGVIAITPDVLSSVLAITGPVTVEEREFRADNTPDELEFQVERGYYQRGIPSRKRKEIIGTLAVSILERTGDFSFEQWRSLAYALGELFREKHILVYINDSRLQEIARNMGITGDIEEPDGDYVMVIDSNMRSQKTDAVMKKEILHTISVDEKERVIGTVKLTYTHTGRFSWKTTTYNDWVRIYVPDGSVFLDAFGVSKNPYSGIIEPVEQSRDHKKTVFSAFFSIPPLSSRSFEIRYQLPKNILRAMKEETYRLFLQKQSGVSGVQSRVLATFPSDIDTVSFDGEMKEQKIDKKTLSFSANLNSDKRIDVTLRAAAAQSYDNQETRH